jgi:hypothetical protein
MTLLNDPASLPSPMWAVVRFLLSADGRFPAEGARALLCPPSLLPGGQVNGDSTFASAVRTLRELGLVTADDDHLTLTPPARELPLDGIAGFSDLLRAAVLDADRNAGLHEDGNQTGPKDLVRALSWFLTLDAFTPLGLGEVTELQDGAFASHFPNPIVNDTRWTRFGFWGPVLGFVARPVLDNGQTGLRLVPDCTAAVRRTMLAIWAKGEQVEAADAVDRILEELPVLPGGLYSRLLALPTPADVASSLSLAMLRGESEGWLSFGAPSDAVRGVFLADPDAVSGTRQISLITISGSLDD